MIKSNDSSNFVILNDVLKDAIFDIRYYSSNNFVGNRIEGYEEDCCLITKEAADALKKVSNELLEKGYIIKIFDAYRPLCAVNYFIKWSKDKNDNRMKKIFYPNLNKTTLFKKGYIAKKSSHCRGSSIDLTLVEAKTKKELDMGGIFDYFGKSSNINYKKITKIQYKNRLTLQKAMISNGFKTLDTEWWHFTLDNEPYKNTYFTFPISKKSIK